MPKAERVLEPMRVQDWGRYVFRVTSQSRPDHTYQVDLLANGGIGHCSCENFSIKRQPLIDAGGVLGNDNLLCKHIKTCRSHFLDQLLSRLSQNENPPTQ